MVFTREALRTLAAAEPERPIVSVFACTDPRDPANTSASPAWHVALRNGLSAVAERLESGDSRDDRLAFRELRPRIEQELTGLEASERARSVAWFIGVEGAISDRFALQLPLREDAVVWDAKPFVSPLVDIADRGAPVGVILVSGEIVRLLQIEQAEPSEPDHPAYELELGDWRPFGGSAGGGPARGTQTTSHQERFEARVDAWRHDLYETAASQTAKRLDELRWERIVLVSEPEVASRFRGALPRELAERIIFESDVNLAGKGASAVAEALEPAIEEAWLARTRGLAELALARARAGEAAAVGPVETLSALAEGRVARLILDPARDLSGIAGMLPASLGGPPELLGERAVEAAVATGAEVTALACADSAALSDAGGIAGLLRY